MSYLKKYFLIIVLVILILVLVFLKIRYGSTNTGKTETTEDKAKPTIEIIGENNQNNVTITEQRSENNQTTIDKIDINSNPAEIDSNKQENDFTDSADYGYSLQPLLPYQGKYFRVEKYFKKGYLEAITKTDDLAKAEEELKTWIDDNEPFPGETKYIFILK